MVMKSGSSRGRRSFQEVFKAVHNHLQEARAVMDAGLPVVFVGTRTAERAHPDRFDSISERPMTT